jgi:hypothetical protein
VDAQVLASDVEAAVVAGIICSVTRNPEGLQSLLPHLGPRATTAALEEVEYHGGQRGDGWDAIDWSTAGSAYQPLEPDELTIHPREWL